MNETRTLKEWMKYHGYAWVEGKEQFMKGEIGVSEARDVLQRLYQEGAVTRG